MGGSGQIVLADVFWESIIGGGGWWWWWWESKGALKKKFPSFASDTLHYSAIQTVQSF